MGYLLRLNHVEVFPGINKRRKPVVREDVWGDLLPDVVGCQQPKDVTLLSSHVNDA